jgi:hypothetical protein
MGYEHNGILACERLEKGPKDTDNTVSHKGANPEKGSDGVIFYTLVSMLCQFTSTCLYNRKNTYIFYTFFSTLSIPLFISFSPFSLLTKIKLFGTIIDIIVMITYCKQSKIELVLAVRIIAWVGRCKFRHLALAK